MFARLPNALLAPTPMFDELILSKDTFTFSPEFAPTWNESELLTTVTSPCAPVTVAAEVAVAAANETLSPLAAPAVAVRTLPLPVPATPLMVPVTSRPASIRAVVPRPLLSTAVARSEMAVMFAPQP